MSVAVADPFGVAADAVMTTLARAVDPDAVQGLLDRGVPELGPPGTVALRALRVVRYKPERRCLIQYDLAVDGGNGTSHVTVLGKVRRNRPGHHQLRLLRAFWEAGFDDGAPDRIVVPEPLGRLAGLDMWLQRRVAGDCATGLLGGPRGAEVAARMADAASKVHRAGVPTSKSHTADDELRILDACLDRVAAERPQLMRPLDSLRRDARRAAGVLAGRPVAGIHRDFYSDQVLVDGDRVTVLDFDLYTRGDPALDIGNLVGHVAEQSLREHGDPRELAHVERAAVERFARHAGEEARTPVAAYAALTLARHVWLAHERPERAHLVVPLLDLARERVAATPRR